MLASQQSLQLAFILLFLIFLRSSPTCEKVSLRSEQHPTVYWINLDRSIKRRQYIEKQLSSLKLKHSRVKAVTPLDLDIPVEIFHHAICRPESYTNIYVKIDNSMNPNYVSDSRIKFSSLCRRPKDSLTELAVTTSHLSAIHSAVSDTNSTSPYAIIIEDDIKISFDIDFNALIASAPKDFTILQLITSNEMPLKILWEKYIMNSNKLWEHRRNHDRLYDYWCAGAYIIHKDRMRSILNPIYQILPDRNISLKVIAGYHTAGCVPSSCCDSNSKITNISPCILSPRGYSADNYIFSLGKSYMITVPLLTSTSYGNRSTFHQNHVDYHQNAFTLINDAIEKMKTKKVPLPNFASNFYSYCN